MSKMALESVVLDAKKLQIFVPKYIENRLSRILNITKLSVSYPYISSHTSCSKELGVNLNGLSAQVGKSEHQRL